MSDYPRQFGTYLLLEPLGAGGMSEVELARKISSDHAYVRFVVIKRIKTDKSTDPGFVRMFKDEARITSELHHANIGAVYDFGRDGDEYFLALEYVPGVDVRFLVNVLRERGQRVPLKVALRIIVDVLNALQYAHNKKDTFGKAMQIVHRDVNPRNIMVSIRGEVKLIDFGVAKAADRLERTRTDHVKGKFSYMAPEQISGLDIDHRADLYAVGLTLHELLSGSSPYFGLNQIQIMHRMLSGQVPAMPEVPELPDASALERAHAKSLAKDPNERFESADAFAAALTQVADSLGGLPTDEQMSTFLEGVDPTVAGRIQAKMDAFATIEVGNDGAIPNALDQERLEEAINAGPMVPRGTEDGQTIGSVTRTGVVAGSMIIGTVGAVVGALAVVLLLGVVAWFVYFGAGDPVEALPIAQPNPQQPVPAADPAPRTPAKVGSVDGPKPEPASTEPATPPEPAPAVTPAPVKPKPTKPKPAAAQPAPAEPKPGAPKPGAPKPAAPEPAAPEPAQPSPAPEPAVVVAPDPKPEPKPAPAVKFGKVNVAAPTSGLRVTIDGKPAGKTPLNKHPLSVGVHQVSVEGLGTKTVKVVSEGQLRFVRFP